MIIKRLELEKAARTEGVTDNDSTNRARKVCPLPSECTPLTHLCNNNDPHLLALISPPSVTSREHLLAQHCMTDCCASLLEVNRVWVGRVRGEKLA